MTDFLTTRYAVLETELGRFLFWSNGERTLDDGRKVDQWGARTEHAHNLPVYRDPSGITADDVDSYVTVNRVDWHFHGFGTLDPKTGEAVRGDLRTQDARRTDWKDAPWESRTKAEAKIYAAILPAIEAYAKTDEGRDFFRAGRYFAANNDAHSLERDLAKLDEQRAEVQAKLKAARKIMAANKA